MWPFVDKKEMVRVLKPLRKCHCGSDRFSSLRSDDAVYCWDCGAMYLIYFGANPVAEYVMVEKGAA